MVSFPLILVGSLVALGLGGIVIIARRAWLETGCAVLLYHRLHHTQEMEGSEALFSIDSDRFRSHLEALQDAGYSFLEPVPTLAKLARGERLPERSILFAFDDGCCSVWEDAAPVLEDKGIAALVFMTTDPEAFVFHLPTNPQRRMSENQVTALAKRGWVIGAHGASHLPATAMSTEQFRTDLSRSIQWVESATGQSVEEYAIPGNIFAERLVPLAREEGIHRIWSASPGLVAGDQFQQLLPRMGVEGTMTGQELLASLEPSGRAWRAIISSGKRLPVRLLGAKRWLPVRRTIFRVMAGISLNLNFWKKVIVAGVGLVAALLLGVL